MDVMKLLVYVPILTPRIKYIFNFIFNEVLKTEVGFSSNLSEFKSSALPKISYADQPVANEVFFKNSDLLLGHSITRPTIKTTAFGDMIVPFAVDRSALPFDVFAASFYFVSRYEEYLPYEPDCNESFPPERSLQNKLKLLSIPVVDAWALILKNILLKHYPNLFFAKKTYSFVPLICMYPASEKVLPDWISLSLRYFRKVRGTLFKAYKEDDAANALLTSALDLNAQYNLKSLFFFKPAQQFDHECDGSMQLPNSYLELLKAGTSNDYRMGYLSMPGFRAGTCTSFNWYDLQLEKTTSLRVHPLTVSDLNLQADKHARFNDTLRHWQQLAETIKLLNGEFYILLHQEFLKEDGKAKKIFDLLT